MTARTPPRVERVGNVLDVGLVCLPFASADRPSLQMGLLQALTERAGHRAQVLQLNLDLAAELTPHLYELLCEQRTHMTGEWLFSHAAFGDDLDTSDADYYDRFPEEFAWGEEHGLDRAAFSRLRHHTLPDFLDRCAELPNWEHFDIVGFSSMFQQNAASLALAKRLKARLPDLPIVFGGANMDGDMGLAYAQAFREIDFVVRGEADQSFPALLDALSTGRRVLQIPGVIIRTGDVVSDGGHAPAIEDLDSLPVPTYDDYFDRARDLALEPAYKATWTLPYESSRGCWWGQKNHCTFCGLNGETMRYRSKSPDRTLAEITELAERHDICSFMAVDNILDVKYIRALFGTIQDERLDYNFFYEIKSNLTQRQIKLLYNGGVRRVQPGIESLSTHVLQLMRKGATMLQNVRCMKWCRYYGIGVNWNLIWGFPGETERDYKEELEVLRSISHLEPPVGSGRIWLERFSPHFDDPSFPVDQVRAEASYRYVYPDSLDLDRAAYFFDYRMADTVAPETRQPTNDFLDAWRTSWDSDERHSLTYRRTADAVLIDRNRGADAQTTVCVTGVSARIFEACVVTMRTPAQVAEHLHEHGWTVATDDVRGALDQFCSAGFALTEDDRYLTIALPQNPNW